jgi:hypothetical protein
MVPEFDPAVAQVLEAFGQLLTRDAGDSVGIDSVIGALAAKGRGVAAELARDPQRAQVILDQLCADGLLDMRGPGGSVTNRRYALTRLGWARVENEDEDDD